MGSNIVTNSEDQYSHLWEIANIAFDELKREEEELKQKKTKKNTNCCKHLNICEDVCNDCGVCMTNTYISTEAEWNNYKDESGGFSKNTQRCDVYKDNNPYSVNSTCNPFNTNTLMGKLQLQQTFTHKQKTYWLVGLELERACGILNITNKDTLEKAKMFWYKYMESGKLTRASVRKGLIAACLFYSCVRNNTPIERQEIIKVFNCDTRTLSKGEKVLFEILNDINNTYINVQSDDSNSFIRYCSTLKLPFNVTNLCNDLYNKYSVELQAVTPKSAVGGIIAYVIKYKLNQKIPTKTVISATVDVCTPTLNKVIQLMYDLENSK